MHWKLIILLVLSLLLVIFAVQNYEVVSIQFLFWSFQTSRTIILFGAFINRGSRWFNGCFCERKAITNKDD